MLLQKILLNKTTKYNHTYLYFVNGVVMYNTLIKILVRTLKTGVVKKKLLPGVPTVMSSTVY